VSGPPHRLRALEAPMYESSPTASAARGLARSRRYPPSGGCETTRCQRRGSRKRYHVPCSPSTGEMAQRTAASAAITRGQNGAGGERLDSSESGLSSPRCWRWKAGNGRTLKGNEAHGRIGRSATGNGGAGATDSRTEQSLGAEASIRRCATDEPGNGRFPNTAIGSLETAGRQRPR